MKLEDGCNTIVLNTKSPIAEIPEGLRPLFEYIEEGKVEQDAFVHEIDDRVEKVSLDEEVRGIMTLEEDFNARERMAVRRGHREEKQEIALNMLKEGMTIDVIAKVTGLTPEQIRTLN